MGWETRDLSPALTGALGCQRGPLLDQPCQVSKGWSTVSRGPARPQALPTPGPPHGGQQNCFLMEAPEILHA